MVSFGSTSRGYGQLTDGQIEVWNHAAKVFLLRSIGKKKIIKDGRSLYHYINLNLYEIGEPPLILPPVFENPQIYSDIKFEFIKKSKKTDIKLYLNPEIKEETKIILSATPCLSKGKHRVKDSWFKKIKVIGSKFKSGDSLMADYLSIFKTVDKDAYKICFKYREVHKRSGISHFAKNFNMYLNPEKAIS